MQFAPENRPCHPGSAGGIRRGVLAVLGMILWVVVASSWDLRGQQSLRTIRIGAFDYYPGIFKKDGKVQGFYVDMLAELAKREGWNIEYVYGTWEEGLLRIQSGEVDVLTSVAKTEQREVFLDFASTPLLTVWGQVYVKKGDFRGTLALKSLEGKQIAVMRGDFNAQAFKRLDAGFKLRCTYVEVGSFEEVFKAIESGRTDAGVVNSTYGAARKNDFGVIESDLVFNPFDIYFAVRKGRSYDVLGTLDRYLTEWKADEHSPYFEARDRWMQLPSRVKIPVVTPWLRNTLLGLAAVTGGSVVFILLLRRQVRVATQEVREQEGRLREMETRFRVLLDSTPNVAVQGFLPDGTIFYWNKASEGFYGYTRAEALGKNVLELLLRGEVSPEARNSLLKSAETGIPMPAGEMRLRRKDGSEIQVFTSYAVVRGEDSRPELFCLDMDLTEAKTAETDRLEMERKLLHVQKLESLGVLAGGIAHDFNNLLSAVLTNLDMAARAVPKESEANDPLLEALEATRKAGELTRQMLAYSGRGRFVIEDLHLSKLVEEVARLLRVSISKKVTLKLDLERRLPMVRVDVAQMQQILMNLITNASDAIGDGGGVIQVRTGITHCDESFLLQSRAAAKPAPGRFGFVEVRDTGCGMDEESLRRLFDPFFTTKTTGRGLGMSAVLGIVQGHHGAIMVSSQPGAGTTIQVLFPASGQEAEYAPEPTPSPSSQTQNTQQAAHGSILVVDDEPIVRKVTARVLRGAGYKVLEAPDGQEGLEVLRGNLEAVHCVILDVTMPRMDGVTALQGMRSIKPELPIILTSGYDDMGILSSPQAAEASAFIRKPFDVNELLTCVAKVLDPTDASSEPAKAVSSKPVVIG